MNFETSDPFTLARMLERELGADPIAAQHAVNLEQDEAAEDDRKQRVRQTSKRYHENLQGIVRNCKIWITPENPVLPFLPNLTAKQARLLASLLMSRRKTPLYLALLVLAKMREGR